jgi:hypothetical protein
MKAFPVTIENHTSYGEDGMDLRDYFAIKYVNGIISNPNFDGFLSFDELAKNSYKMADEMMKARAA